MLRAILLLVLLLAPRISLEAQERDLLVRLGGEAGEILRTTISQPYILLEAGPEGIELPRDTVYDLSVVIIRGPAYVSSTVRGDVVVVGGDLFMRPGAEIGGRAVAVGGSTHHSTMARAAGGLWSFRFLRVEIREIPSGFEVREAPAALQPRPVITFPGLYGVRFPAYNRVAGVALPWGPELGLLEGRLRINPLVTYRSAPGVFDLSGHVLAEVTPAFAIEAFGGRGTFTNDAWNQSDPANTVTMLARGRDYRNYFRAERFEGRLMPRVNVGEVALTFGAGARTERAWSVPTRNPWAITGRDHHEGTARPNPEILDGRITSALGSVEAAWQGAGVTLTGGVHVEAAFDAPEDLNFVQTTLDGAARIPTFGFQTLTFRVRAMHTGGDPAPPQRYSYIGGSGTLPTFPILSMGGDRLLFIESAYNIPIEAINIRMLQSPTVSLRHMLGAAGVERLPSLEQNIGLRVALGFFRADAVLEPVDGRTHFELGFTFIR